MADTTNIAWVRNSDGTPGATFNPWIGCTRVSAGCAGCYAEKLATSRLGVEWGKGKPRRRTAIDNWKKPRRWNRQAEAKGIRIRIFCASLADVFDAEVPAEWRADLWGLIRETPNLDWIIVTKRPENIRSMLPEGWSDGWPNVWLVVTVEDQDAADRRIRILLETPAVVRGVSMEPLLGPVDLRNINGGCLFHIRWIDCLHSVPLGGGMGGGVPRPRLDWVIVGGESGTDARSCNVEWIWDLVRQCDSANVPVFVKQLGARFFDEENMVGGAAIRLSRDVGRDLSYRLKHPAGADPAEWPEGLLVQQMPMV